MHSEMGTKPRVDTNMRPWTAGSGGHWGIMHKHASGNAKSVSSRMRGAHRPHTGGAKVHTRSCV